MNDELGALAAFVAVARERSFTRAAARLDTSQSALSHKIRRLEDRLGLKLLTRTTRSVAPTDAGQRLLDTLVPALDGINGQLEALAHDAGQPSGLIRISSADHAAETIVWPAVARLLAGHPALRVEITVENELVDIVAAGYHAGVRLGSNVAKDMIAVQISAPQRQVVVGSPAYLRSRPAPVTPEELTGHACINRRMPSQGGLHGWQFTRNGRSLRVRVDGQLALNRPEMIVSAALDGFGLALMLDSQVADLVAQGRLVRLLDDWCPPLPSYFLYYPAIRQVTPGFQALVEALRYRPAA